VSRSDVRDADARVDDRVCPLVARPDPALAHEAIGRGRLEHAAGRLDAHDGGGEEPLGRHGVKIVREKQPILYVRRRVDRVGQAILVAIGGRRIDGVRGEGVHPRGCVVHCAVEVGGYSRVFPHGDEQPRVALRSGASAASCDE